MGMGRCRCPPAPSLRPSAFERCPDCKFHPSEQVLIEGSFGCRCMVTLPPPQTPRTSNSASSCGTKCVRSDFEMVRCDFCAFNGVSPRNVCGGTAMEPANRG
jgi:hypothetical protein